ncbi:hypothetical protein PMNALOAF_3016 [Methylobacterium adhaesivum]|uniref:Rieske (2Fe-2S) protein n=1 Tax=Methylobacterium adhaesivum TaxID=333297 RepID=A0ABT8BM18_9HYPH|nr:Rieske (2Fe-2S) protein [Methylobacterium adhaesivum]MDN3592241.1 Rieske (2Fe-2S) protein [Methylobacterium adhaesivum]GJD31753.1 hypothetical protein PMNALOAF_3016 [Methylobacterium adhaesivum]
MCAKPISEANPASAADGARWVHACGRDALASRGLVPVFVAGRHLLLVQDGTTLFAVERACPHEGADLALGHCAAGRLHCPRHQAWFSLTDGAVSPGWSFRGLETFATRHVGDDVEIRIGHALGAKPVT